MKIEGIEIIHLSPYDGKPIKNHLPGDLRERLRTQNQWLELGYVLKKNAIRYEMHPSSLSKKLCFYFLDTDVEKMKANSMPKNCLTCDMRDGRFCEVAGDYVNSKWCCSEWIPIGS